MRESSKVRSTRRCDCGDYQAAAWTTCSACGQSSRRQRARGAPDRIGDVANPGQLVDQQLLLGHVDLSEAKIVRHDMLGVAQHVGTFDHLALPGSAGKVLPVDRLADSSVAVLCTTDVGYLQHQVGDVLVEHMEEIDVRDLGVFQCVV
jgi:hypothetical protein